MPQKEIWNQCLNAVGEKISQQSFDIWVKPLKLLKMTETFIELEVPNKFFKDWLSENYQSIIKDVLFQITKNQYSVHFCLKEGKEEEEKDVKPRSIQKTPSPRIIKQTN